MVTPSSEVANPPDRLKDGGDTAEWVGLDGGDPWEAEMDGVPVVDDSFWVAD